CAHSEMNRLQFSRMRVGRTGGVLLALLLIAGFIFTATPIESVLASNTCALACCAGRAPHAAGSCMDGTCHAAIRLKNKFHTHAPTAEKLCGSQVIRLKTFATTVVDTRDKDERPQGKSLHLSSVRQPCAPDCAGCATFSTSNSQSKVAALAVANQLPADPLKFLSAIFDRADTLDVACRQHSPRGPPDPFHRLTVS
ncbi:MAG TPA: hypothetical protein VE969_01560, partial [Pyrinomonadaceae bacterium]|nr:hypothetical protein [Pyrinomonadaceae bacterium]